jgi:hypothetical protein
MYEQRAARFVANHSDVPRLVQKRLGVRMPEGAPAAAMLSAAEQEGRRVEKLVLETEPGIRVPATFVAGSQPAVVFVGATEEEQHAAARAGHAVLAVTPRAFGADRGPASGYSSAWQRANRALLLGASLAALQVTDILRAMDYLRSRKDVNTSGLRLFGRGNGGTLALYAANLQPQVSHVAVEQSIVSYMDVVRSRIHQGLIGLIVPGVLQDFDLPDLVRRGAPLTLWMADPRTPAGGRASLAAAAQAYPSAKVFERPEGWAFDKVYREWLGAAR